MSANCWRAASERGPAVKSFDIHFDKEGDTMNVLITGAGRREALGYNLVRRCLERGDTVIATVRRPSEALAELWRADPERLHVLTMDIASSESVRAAAADAAKIVPCIDLMINNAVTTSPDCGKEFMQTNLDYIAGVIDVGAVARCGSSRHGCRFWKKAPRRLSSTSRPRRAASAHATAPA